MILIFMVIKSYLTSMDAHMELEKWLVMYNATTLKNKGREDVLSLLKNHPNLRNYTLLKCAKHKLEQRYNKEVRFYMILFI